MTDETNEVAGFPAPPAGAFCWTEIASGDADKTQAFFENVFGWSVKKGDASNSGMDYREFYPSGGGPEGGLYQIDPKWFGDNPPPPHFMIYIAVDDVDANAAKAAELGGKVHKEPFDIPNVGRMAVIQDPTGAMFCTFKGLGW